MDQPPSERALPRSGVRRFKKRRKKGKLVELQDNTEWEVSPGHEIFTEHWTAESDITVVPGGFPEYPFDLINAESGDRVPARYRGLAPSARGWKITDH
jgi:hypothetical protein